jgi:hypothetical protein
VDAVDVISAASQFFVAFCAGVGAATYLIVRKLSKQMYERVREAEADIDLMYALHKMEPPSVGREKLRDSLRALEDG